MKFVVFDQDGYEVRRGQCASNDITAQANHGEIAIEHEWEGHYSPSLFLTEEGDLEERERPVTQSEVDRRSWKQIKRELALRLNAGYPSQYGPVDLRPGARQVMITAVTVGQGLDLILLDNSVVALSAAELSTLLADALGWEQARVAETQALRP